MNAVKKNYRLERLKDEELRADEKKIPEAAFVVARSRIEGHERKYETVARILLTGVTELLKDTIL